MGNGGQRWAYGEECWRGESPRGLRSVEGPLQFSADRDGHRHVRNPRETGERMTRKDQGNSPQELLGLGRVCVPTSRVGKNPCKHRTLARILKKLSPQERGKLAQDLRLFWLHLTNALKQASKGSNDSQTI